MKRKFQFFKKPVVVIMLSLAGLFYTQQNLAQGSQSFTTVGANTFTAPAGVTNVTVECWGGGGAGGGNNSSNGTGGGGGGGSYVKILNVAVVSGTNYTISVGAGGSPSVSSGLGGTSTASLVTSVSAQGGNGGTFSTNGTGGTGGIGTTNGGTGSNGASGNFGGGGGGGAGTAANGNTVTGSATGATAVAGGGPGGNGASGGNGNGSAPATTPGGGGGGARAGGAGRTGGAGGAGKVTISWACPAAAIAYAGTPFCLSAGSGTVTLTGSSGGSFSAQPTLTINTTNGELTPSSSAAGTYTVHYQIASGGNGCTAVDATTTVTISQPPLSSVTDQTNVTCFGANDGTITVSASGGTAPYTFSIDNGTNFLVPTGTNSRLFTGLASNTPFTIKVKDSKGCESK